jgi:hypothetical protein
MKSLSAPSAAVAVAVGLLWFGPGASVTAAQLAGPVSSAPQGNVITCSSDDMKRHYCAADVRGGAQLVRQRSGSPCIFNETWGYVAGRGIWVDRGCRADFVTRATWGGWSNGYNIYCASDNGKRNWCPTNTRYGVQMVRQRSGSPCVYGRTWGFDARGVWVDRGCRADFQIGGNNWQPGEGGRQVVNCSSNDMGRNMCPVNTGNDVRLIRQRSEADCVYGSTWGYNANGIWVDRGCRADFEIGADSNWQQPGAVTPQVVTCASDDMRRHDCAADTRGNVRLVRQRSEAQCVYGSTWGYDANGIWVDRGCRADFAIGGDNNWQQPGIGSPQAVTCASDDMRRHYCAADTRGNVRLVRQRSEAQCVYGRTWGYDANGIWVDRGCRADFEVGSYY